MRGFGAPDKPRERSAYEDSAHSGDVAALLGHLHLDAVDVIGYSMSCGTTARLLALSPQRVKSAILAGVGDYALEDNVTEFPKSWPIPDSVPRARLRGACGRRRAHAFSNRGKSFPDTSPPRA
jgi:pimeloyl-ACP methyl ester carboxylesterase